jgi:hypothetical protein
MPTQLTINSITNTLTNTSNLGGPFTGYSAPQTQANERTSENAMYRRVVRRAWNNPYAVGNVNGYKRVTTPFRAVNNLGDFLGRVQYVCGGSNQVNASKPGMKSIIGSIRSQCDGTNVPASVCNTKFVADSSDYVTFKKQMAMTKNYNDLKMGGDQNNASYVNMMAAFYGH